MTARRHRPLGFCTAGRLLATSSSVLRVLPSYRAVTDSADWAVYAASAAAADTADADTDVDTAEVDDAADADIVAAVHANAQLRCQPS